MAETNRQEVTRRRVFYIPPGYDPIHPRRYRELYRKEGAAQAAICGYSLDLIGRQGGTETYGWQVNSTRTGGPRSKPSSTFWSGRTSCGTAWSCRSPPPPI